MQLDWYYNYQILKRVQEILSIDMIQTNIM